MAAAPAAKAELGAKHAVVAVVGGQDDAAVAEPQLAGVVAAVAATGRSIYLATDRA